MTLPSPLSRARLRALIEAYPHPYNIAVHLNHPPSSITSL